MTEIYLAENHLLLEAGYGNPEMHSHSASHVLIGLHGDMCVITDGKEIKCRGAILPSGIAHTVDSFGQPLLVFLFDITSAVSKQIRHFTVLGEQTAGEIACSYQMMTGGNPAGGYGDFFSEVMGRIGIYGAGSRVTDERIALAMRFVEGRIQETVTAKDAAGAACLSESRFSHLFREQAGIAFSGYCSWSLLKKLYDTIK